MVKQSKTKPSFETQLARLESIVGELERQALPLDQALQLYEEGVGLIKHCQKTLTEAEQRVSIAEGSNA